MADIELVIKIDEEVYKKAKEVHDVMCDSVWLGIKYGTQLPKGHWIHRTKDGGCFWEECSVCHTERAFPTKYCPDCGTYMYADIRTEAPTIIESDAENLCDSCKTKGCIFQSGIVRSHCDFYKTESEDSE